MVLIIFGSLLILIGIIALAMIYSDMLQNDGWTSMFAPFRLLFLLIYAFTEFEHDYKWLVIATWIIAPIAGGLLIFSGLARG